MRNFQSIDITLFCKNMKKYWHLIYILSLLFLVSCTKTICEIRYSQQMVEKRALKTFMSNTREQQLTTAKWDYVTGLVANAVLKAWQQYPDKTGYYLAVKAYADFCLQGKDTIQVGQSNIDDLAAGKIFFALYKQEIKLGNYEDARRYKNCAAFLRNKLKYNHERIAAGKPGSGGFFQKARYPDQMWLDGLYMGPAFYAEWQNYFGDENGTHDNEESWSDIANQFITIHRYSYNKGKKLNYHVWSSNPDEPSSFWAKKNEPYKGCSPEFWGRGEGWYFAALVDVLGFMPKSHKDYQTLVHITNDVAEGLSLYQDKKSGCWYQLLQYDYTKTADGKGDTINGQVFNIGNNPNYLESSASSMFTYAYLKGIRLGILEKKKYGSVAEKAYRGLIKTFIRNNENGELDIIQSCASAGLGPKNDPSRSGTTNYYLCGNDTHIVRNEGKAIGPFIMASLEWENIK